VKQPDVFEHVVLHSVQVRRCIRKIDVAFAQIFDEAVDYELRDFFVQCVDLLLRTSIQFTAGLHRAPHLILEFVVAATQRLLLGGRKLLEDVFGNGFAVVQRQRDDAVRRHLQHDAVFVGLIAQRGEQLVALVVERFPDGFALRQIFFRLERLGNVAADALDERVYVALKGARTSGGQSQRDRLRRIDEIVDVAPRRRRRERGRLFGEKSAHRRHLADAGLAGDVHVETGISHAEPELERMQRALLADDSVGDGFDFRERGRVDSFAQ